MRIVVVNDEPAMRRILTEILERAGHQVTVFAYGAEALKELHTTPADLVITDGTNYPMDGIDFIHRVRQISNTPIIVVSGWAAEFESIHGDLANGYFSCAFHPEDLLARIQSVAA